MSKNKSENELVVSENKPDKLEKASNKSEKSENVVVTWCKDTLQFLREVWIEVRPNKGRVTWPTFASVRISTRVVIISSICLGLFIGLCDLIFTYAYSAIINSASGTGIG